MTKEEYINFAQKFTKSMKAELLNDFIQTNTSVKNLSITKIYEQKIRAYVLKYLEEYNNEQ